MIKNLIIILLGTAVAGLLALNVATLINAAVHDLLFEAISHLPFTRSLPNSPTAQKRKLQRHSSTLHKEQAILKAEKKALQSKLKAQSQKVHAVSDRITKRLVRNTSINVSSTAGEAVPWIGTALVVAVTAMDVKDACDTMNDINEIASEFELEGKNEEAKKVCGYKTNYAEQYKAMERDLGGFLAHLKTELDEDVKSFQRATGGTTVIIVDSAKEKSKTVFDAIGGTIYCMLHPCNIRSGR